MEMMKRIIDDVDKALDAEAYMAALSLVLTIPDICSQVEYPDEKSVSKRYILWCDKYLDFGGKQKNDTENDKQKMPYLNGEVIYQLRCFILHQGIPTIDNDKIKNPEHKIDYFEVVFNKNKFAGDFSYVYSGTHYQADAGRLCLVITNIAYSYYEENKDKFTPFNYKIIEKYNN